MSSKNVEALMSSIRSPKKTILRADRSNLSNLPLEKIRQKPMTSVAIFSYNSLTTLSSGMVFEIANFGWKHSLTELHLDHNQIEIIPREISLFMQLRVLTFENNHVRSLPRDLGKLIKLEVLLFSHNEVLEIPLEFGQLTSLRKLSFTGNLVRKFPPNLARLENLRKVNFENNPIIYPPPDVTKQGWNVIRSYLNEPLKFITKRYTSCSNLSNASKFSDRSDLSDLSRTSRGSLGEMTSALRRVLIVPEARQSFASFLEKEYSLENLLFWQEVEHLNSIESQLQPEDYETEATKIYWKYIQEKTDDNCIDQTEKNTLAVNLSFEIKTRCSETFAKCQNEKKTDL